MRINDLVASVRGALKKEDLFQTNTKEAFDKINEEFEIKQNYNQVKADFLELDLDINCLYHCKDSLSPFWYVDGFVYIELMGLDKGVLEFMQVKERLEAQSSKLKEHWDSKNYSSFFLLMESKFSMDFFLNNYKQIPKDKLYKVFQSLYVSSDYGFGDIKKEIITYMFSLNKDKSFKKNLNADKDGFLAIYRGTSTKSNSVEKAYSWTLNFNTALFFATRFNGEDAKVYKAKIHIDNVVDFITRRNEDEILLLPENLVEVEDMELLNFNKEFMENLREGNIDYIDYFQNKRDFFIREDLFQDPDGTHGVRHTKRVLLLVALISHLENIDEFDMDILSFCALYHDIGRSHDDKCRDHGKTSVDIIDDYSLFEDYMMECDTALDNDDYEIASSIIKNHSIDDEEGIKDIMNNSNIFDKERAVRLYKLFKDADALDRVRIRDFDFSYLRNNSSKKLPIVAKQLLSLVK